MDISFDAIAVTLIVGFAAWKLACGIQNRLRMRKACGGMGCGKCKALELLNQEPGKHPRHPRP